MNFIVVGVIAPLAYFLLRLAAKRIVMMILKQFNKPEVNTLISCENCGTYFEKQHGKRINGKFICDKADCVKNAKS